MQCIFLRADCVVESLDSVDGVISSRVDGNRLQVWVRNWDETKSQKLQSKMNLAEGVVPSVLLEGVGLEELFTGMTS